MAGQNLMAASHQWASRPADERFWTLKELILDATAQFHENTDTTISLNQVAVAIKGGDVRLQVPYLPGDDGLRFNSWSFGQFCQNISAPAPWLRNHTDNMPLVQEALEASLAKASKRRENRDDPNYQLYHNGRTVLALNRKIARVPNCRIAARFANIQGNWRTAPGRAHNPDSPTARKATEADCGPFTFVKPGELIDKAGLYMSPEDMFLFMVNTDRQIRDGSDSGLYRGFFASNSEVGKKGFSLTSFLFRGVCGNNIVWESEEVEIFRRKHIGANAEKDIFAGIDKALEQYSNLSAAKDEQRIQSAQRELWLSSDDMAKDLQDLNLPVLGVRRVKEVYEVAQQHADTDGSPRSPWGIANALTRISQITSYTDQRVALDDAAGRVLRKFVTV